MTTEKRSTIRAHASLLVCLAAAVALLGAFERGVDLRAQDALPIKDVRLPIARYPDGSIHRQLHAAAATMSQTGPIRGRDVRVESFDPEGQLEMVVEAVECEYDRTDGTVKSTEAVEVRSRGIVLTGMGFDLDTKAEQIRVLDDVRVVFNRKQVKRKSK